MRRIVPSLLLVLLLAAFMASTAAAREAVKGPGYRAFAPTGWVIGKSSSRGWRMVTITPPAHVYNKRDTALVSIAVAPVKTVEKLLHSGVSDKGAVVQKLISIPTDATLVQKQFGPTPTTLHGAKGDIFGVSYNLKGFGTQHSATVVRRGKRIYLLQVIRDQGLSELGASAADMIRDTWRWK